MNLTYLRMDSIRSSRPPSTFDSTEPRSTERWNAENFLTIRWARLAASRVRRSAFGLRHIDVAKKRRGRNEGALFEDKTRGRWTAYITVAGKRYKGHAKTKELAKEKLLSLQLRAKQGLLG